jgi:imidazolonepropionase-like amidohydrolase
VLIVEVSSLQSDADAPLQSEVAITIDAGRITGIEPRGSIRSNRDGVEVLDWRGLTVVPGFVDAHLHVTTRGAGRLHEEMKEDDRQALAKGEVNLLNALGWGVTTVRDAGSWNAPVLELRDRIAKGLMVGPRILAAGAPLTTHHGHLYWFGGQAEGVHQVRRFVQEQAARGMSHVKVMATGGWATPGSDPRVPQYSVDELAAAVDEAHRHGMHTMAHLASTEGVRRSLTAHIDTLEHAMLQRADGRWEYPDDVLDAIVEGKVWVDPTPAWHYRTVQSPPATITAERLEALREARASRMEVYRRLVARGHDRWLVGTDTGGTNPRDLFPLVCEIMVRDIGLTPRDVLRAATLNGAAAVGLQGEVGAIRPGMSADLVGLGGNPTRDVMSFWQVRGVIAQGRVLDPVPDHSVLDESVGGGWE